MLCDVALASMPRLCWKLGACSIRMLHYRFRSSGLPSPELDLMESTATRLRSGCDCEAELGGHSLRLSTPGAHRLGFRRKNPLGKISALSFRSMARRLTVSFLLVFCFFSSLGSDDFRNPKT